MGFYHRVAPSAAARVAILALVTLCTACAGTLRPSVSLTLNDDALLVLTGFGYNRAGERALRSLAPEMAKEGFDLYVPAYLTRSGLDSGRAKLERFIRDARLDRYRRLHVFAFIAGAWTINPLIDGQKLPNLVSVVYDRSPYQERAPAVAADQLRLFAWLRYGSTIFDIARASYAPISEPGVNVALMVESAPTSFIRRHEHAARAYGPFAFECTAFGQRYDDCAYLSLSHDELYVRFPEVWPELLAFIRTSRFSSTMNRTPPAGDPLAPQRR